MKTTEFISASKFDVVFNPSLTMNVELKMCEKYLLQKRRRNQDKS